MDPISGDLYKAYMQGWSDGASRTPSSADYISHEVMEIREAYQQGYTVGLSARDRVSRATLRRYRHHPVPYAPPIR